MKEDTARLVWRRTSADQDEGSTSARYITDGRLSRLYLGVEAGGRLRFRLNLAERPCFIEISFIRIYHQGTVQPGEALVAEWCPENNFAGLVPSGASVLLESGESFRLMATGDDSQIHFEAHQLEEAGGEYAVEIIMRALEPSRETASAELLKLCETVNADNK